MQPVFPFASVNRSYICDDFVFETTYLTLLPRYSCDQHVAKPKYWPYRAKGLTVSSSLHWYISFSIEIWSTYYVPAISADSQDLQIVNLILFEWVMSRGITKQIICCLILKCCKFSGFFMKISVVWSRYAFTGWLCPEGQSADAEFWSGTRGVRQNSPRVWNRWLNPIRLD